MNATSSPLGSALALLCVGSLASAACQSSSTAVIGPSGTKCAITVPATLPTIGADGGSGTVAVTVAAECVWSASSASQWIAITSTPNGQGNGNITFSAAGNPTATTRRGTLVVGERRVEISQAGAACQYALSPQTATLGAEGGQGTFTLSTLEGCQWSASSQAAWLSIAGAASGTGPGSVSFTVAQNGAEVRTGLIAIADRTFAVNQAGTSSSCAFVDRSELQIGAAGGTERVTVTATGPCAWSAASQSPWITIAAGSPGSGSGTVSLTVAGNSGAARTGLVTIAGFTVVVSQAASPGSGCTYALNATQFSAPATGAVTSVNVTSRPGCAWTASSAVPWIVVTPGAVGNGSGTALLAIAANAGATRTGVVTIAGQAYTVTQAAAASCEYRLSADAQTVPAAGGTATIAVTAGSACAWTASSQTSWITVAAGATGVGSGNVTLAIAANAGPQRSGTVTIAGETFTVTELAAPAACSYSITPTTQSVPPLGGDFSVSITTQPGCTWAASTSDSWIQLTSETIGAGSGVLTYRVGLGGLSSRSGRITVADQALTVNQSAVLLDR